MVAMLKTKIRVLACEGLFMPAGDSESAVPVTAEFSEIESGRKHRLQINFQGDSGPQGTLIADSRLPYLPPVSFATQLYAGDLDGQPYQLEPVAGPQYLDPVKALDCPPGYLYQEWPERLNKETINFRWAFVGDESTTRGVFSFKRAPR